VHTKTHKNNETQCIQKDNTKLRQVLEGTVYESLKKREKKWTMKMRAFWDIVLCSLFGVDRHFRGAYCLHHQGDLTKMDNVFTSVFSIVNKGRPYIDKAHDTEMQ
jgi:hypothetical protein